MRKFGATLVVLGIGSFVLPFFGLQFKIINIFGEAQWIIAIIAIIVGILMVIFGKGGESNG